MEYLRKNEYFPFKTVIIDDSLQNTLGQGHIKNIGQAHIENIVEIKI